MKIEINSNILVWAIEESHLSVFDVADKMGKSKQDIEEWERGEDFPTYSQLEKLAYDILKKPIAVFFFPKPPIIGNIQKSFRSLPEAFYNGIPNKIIRLINDAKVMQINLYELNDGQNPAINKINKLIIEKNIFRTAKILKEILDVDLIEQKNIRQLNKAFEYWRKKLSKLGIYVFKEAFKNDDFSGFCIHDKNFPIIYVNNSMPFSRQIFTLFHELYHLLCGTSGLDLINDDYIYGLEDNMKDIEIACNAFAGEFLVPKEDFIRAIKAKVIDEETIEKLAHLYSVSREVILRKLLDINKISNEVYKLKSNEYTQEAIKIKKQNKKSGGDYYNNKIAYLGIQYISLAYQKYNSKKIDIYQLADYLKIKSAGISAIEARLFKREV